MVHRRLFVKIYSLKFCDIWQNFYFNCILNNENFKMEVEQTNFVTHLLITIQLSNDPSKVDSNFFCYAATVLSPHWKVLIFTENA